MNYIVMDLEFNQPFDFERGEKTTLVEDCPFEIIQIGIVKMDEAFAVTGTKCFMIRPQLYKRMHPFVEKITGLRRAMFDGERTFPETYAELLGFVGGDDDVICVWGASDMKLLYKNVLFYNLDATGLTRKYLNVQRLASSFLGLPAGMNIGLKNAVEALSLPTESAFHDALNDAAYTAEILKLVRAEAMPVETFDPGCFEREKGAQRQGLSDTKRLYAEAEKLFGRKLSRKEKSIVRKVYAMGRAGRFDTERRK